MSQAARTNEAVRRCTFSVRIPIAILLASALPFLNMRCGRAPHVAAWTVMVYLAGDDSDLASSIEQQFKQLTSVGSTCDVNIIAQWDRRGQPDPCTPDQDLDNPQWKETLRFRVTKGMPPTRRSAYQNLCEQNMAAGSTLADFVADTQRRFPARRYALIVSGHGFGFQLQLQKQLQQLRPERREMNRTSFDSFLEYLPLCCTPEPSTSGGTPYRSGTPDESVRGDVLYNRELAEALASVLKQPLDVLVFDECNMGMIETAHAVRKVTRIMVASEEVIPGRGILMHYWLKPLVHFPRMNGPILSALIVHTYQATVICSPSYTMSAYDTEHIGSLSIAISGLASAMLDELPSRAAEIVNARNKIKEYGANLERGRIDLERFCWKLIVKSSGWRVKVRALKVIFWLRILRVANGPSIFSLIGFGSHGLAIYFPRDGQAYCFDGSTECGYERCNTHEPVEFVHDTVWTDFLHRYFAIVWSVDAGPDPQHPHALPATCDALSECARGDEYESNATGCIH
jgi:hypothetical protein